MLATYAVAVALNSFLPANIGTWVMLLMLTSLISGASFAMVFSGLVVEKIPFTVFNLALYLYLFLTVRGSFSIKLGPLVVLLVFFARVFWVRLEKLRRELLAGGAILRSRRRTLTDLFPPALGSYAARLAIIAFFLGAYGIPVSLR